MKKIVKASQNLNERTTVNFIVAPSSDIKQLNEPLKVAGWVIVEDEGGKQVLVISDGVKYYGTISPTFIDGFITIVDIMGDLIGENINVVKSTSRNGRVFLSCSI